MAIGTRCMETAQPPKPKPAPAPAPAKPTPQPAQRTALACAAAASVSGILLFLCYFPAALGSYLGWIALVPMLVLVRTQLRPSVIFLIATIGGLAWYIPALSWMRVADRAMVLGWFALSLYCALYVPAAIFAVRALERWHLPLVLSLPLVWTALEFFRSFFLTGFAWYYLGHTQHDNLVMIQIADLGGVYLVSFVIAAVNALLFDCAYQFPEIRAWFGQAELEPYRFYSSVEILNRTMATVLIRRNLIIEGSAVVLLVVGTYVYGLNRMQDNQFPTGPIVCLLQSNLDQRLRERAPEDIKGAQEVMEHYRDLCNVAARDRDYRPDLLIWPETSFPWPWFDIDADFPTEKLMHEDFRFYSENNVEMRKIMKNLAEKTTLKIPNLIGMNSFHLTPDGRALRYNKAILFDGAGNPEARYDKIHRLPWGEYVPLKDWLPFLSVFTPYEGDFGIQAGTKYTRLKSGNYRYGVLICFEDTDPFLARRYLDNDEDGQPVDFLVNLSNDGWFDGSSEHEEHLAISRFRAIECRRALVRSVNMGVSAVIDGNGRVLKPRRFGESQPPMWAVAAEMKGVPSLPVSSWHEFKKKPGVILAAVPIDRRFSLYTVFGDWLPTACWAALLGSACWALYKRRKAPMPA